MERREEIFVGESYQCVCVLQCPQRSVVDQLNLPELELQVVMNCQ